MSRRKALPDVILSRPCIVFTCSWKVRGFSLGWGFIQSACLSFLFTFLETPKRCLLLYSSSQTICLPTLSARPCQWVYFSSRCIFLHRVRLSSCPARQPPVFAKKPQPVAPKNIPGEEVKISNYCTQSQLLNTSHFMNPFLTKWGVYVKLFHGVQGAGWTSHSQRMCRLDLGEGPTGELQLFRRGYLMDCFSKTSGMSLHFKRTDSIRCNNKTWALSRSQNFWKLKSTMSFDSFPTLKDFSDDISSYINEFCYIE